MSVKMDLYSCRMSVSFQIYNNRIFFPQVYIRKICSQDHYRLRETYYEVFSSFLTIDERYDHSLRKIFKPFVKIRNLFCGNS